MWLLRVEVGSLPQSPVKNPPYTKPGGVFYVRPPNGSSPDGLHACDLMEDVRQRLGGLGLSGRAMDQVSDVEWKLGEMKVCVLLPRAVVGLP